MERAGEIVKVEGEAMRLVALRGPVDHPRELRDRADHVHFAGIGKKGEISACQALWREIRARKGLVGLAKDRGAAGVGVLHVEDRVLARLLEHLLEVEI